ncbi:MAG: FG-GAP repeat domain-containing protein [Thermoanaerobaculia bacterium]
MLNGRSALSRTPLLLVLAVALAASACNPAQPRTAPEARQEPAAKAQEPAAPAQDSGQPQSGISPAAQAALDRAKANQAAAPTEVQPPDGKWLVDAQGHQYFVYDLPRTEGTYQWVEEGKSIRVRYGLVLDVESYDDKTFHVRYYRPVEAPASNRKPQLTDEDRARVAATYKASLKSADRLRFAPMSEGLPVQGQWREGFEIADINGDGRLDIVHGPARKSGSRPVVFLGQADGTWKRWAELQVPPVPFDYGDAAVGDLNGDGKADLVLASHLRGITAMIGDGQGGFSLWSKGIDFMPPDQSGGPTAFSSRAIALADWNRDGKLDIVAEGEGPSFAPTRGGGRPKTGESRGSVIYLNNGDGSWTRKDGAAGTFSDTVVTADVNGDGRMDFVTGSGQLGIKAILNLGREDGGWEAVNVPEVRPNALVSDVAVADLNGDGRQDLVVGYSSSEAGVWRTGVDLLLGDAAGTWRRETLAAEESQAGIWSVAAGDLDGDRAADIVAMDGEGHAWVFLGDGKGSFVREASPEIGPADGGNCRGYHTALVDLDGDGRAEVIAEFSGEGQDVALSGTANLTCPSGGSIRAWKLAPRAAK